MSRPSTFAKRALVAAAGVAALAAAVPASAQSYGGYGDSYGGGYDPCRRESNGRGIVGALLGGAIGASVGANAGARGNRQDGALLGGALGAMGGAVIGKNSAACGSGPRPYNAPRSSYDNGYNQYGYNGYSGSAYSAPYAGGAYYGDRAYAYGDRYEDDGYAYGRRGERYRMSSRPAGADGCSLAESPIHMPDGRTQMRFVRVCMDESGRYQVVD